MSRINENDVRYALDFLRDCQSMTSKECEAVKVECLSLLRAFFIAAREAIEGSHE